MLNMVLSFVPLTTDLMDGIFGPINCSGYACVADVLQYTVYAVMIPFFGMGGAQTIKSWFGNPEKEVDKMSSGGDGTAKK